MKTEAQIQARRLAKLVEIIMKDMENSNTPREIRTYLTGLAARMELLEPVKEG